MFRLFTCAMVFAFLSLTWAARAVTPAKKAPVKKSSAASGKTSSKSKSSAKKGTAGKKAPVRSATTWRNRQMAPTLERYRQIQEALATKGYLRPEDATGVWSTNSVDALKRFQMEQKIDPSGKINSLSLIALGLGPSRDPALAKPPQPPPAQ
jgi:peptidoglycan hydrolase-like protein with peptidoglycan-binding domain